MDPAFQTAAGRRRLHTLTEQKKKEMAERGREAEARATVVGCLTATHMEPHIEQGEEVVSIWQPRACRARKSWAV